MAYTSFSTLSDGSEGEHPEIGDFFGPGHVDQLVRQALQSCWMALPKQKRTVDEVESQVRRLVDRALEDFREDRDAFSEDKSG